MMTSLTMTKSLPATGGASLSAAVPFLDSTMSPPDRIDAIGARNRAKRDADKRAEEARKPKAIVCKLDITPADPDWNGFRNCIVAELKQKSLADVLNTHFQSDQKHLLLPPMRDGTILDLQRKNAVEYKEIMATSAFNGVRNNLATKLTMMHFGLPIEPCSLTNILNCDNDEDDADDADPEPARVQRITYAEKPLEFLDGYHLRGYGLPMLRTKKAKPVPQLTRMQPSLDATVSPTGSKGAMTNSTSPPIVDLNDANQVTAPEIRSHLNPQFFQQSRADLPGGSSVSMRGGAGRPPWSPPLRTGLWAYFYLFNGTAIPFMDPEDIDGSQFLQIALGVIGAPPGDNWKFFLDCYNNQPQNKNKLVKPLQDNVRIMVNQSNFDSLWLQAIRSRLYNSRGDWHMVVRPFHEEQRSTFTPGALRGNIATTTPAATQILATSSLNSVSTKPKFARERYLNEDGQWTIPAYTLDGQRADFWNDPRAFVRAVKVILPTAAKGAGFQVSLYTRSGRPNEDFRDYHETFDYPNAAGDNIFRNRIGTKVFDGTNTWSVVVHPMSTRDMPLRWPYPDGQNSLPDTIAQVPAAAKTPAVNETPWLSEGGQWSDTEKPLFSIAGTLDYKHVRNTHADFVDAVKAVISVPQGAGWQVSLYSKDVKAGQDFYTGEDFRRLAHTVIFPNAGDANKFQAQISPYIWDGTPHWGFVAHNLEIPAPTTWPPQAATKAPLQPPKVTGLSPLFPRSTARKATYVLYSKDSGKEILDNDKSFFDAACRLLKLKASNATFAAWIYQKDQMTGIRNFDTTVQVTAETVSSVYRDAIRASLINTNFEVIVTAPKEMLEDDWAPKLPWLYGYAGKVRTSADQGAFLATALELLRIDPTSDYTFYVDFIATGTSLPASTVTIHKRTAVRTFQNQIRGLISRVGSWNAFVRLVGPKPSDLEPKDNLVIKLNLNDTRVGYWKCPTNLLAKHGINQFQNDFRRAMYILFPPTNFSAQPKTQVHLDKYSLGIGGMDLTPDAWSKLSTRLGAATGITTLHVTVDAEIPPEDDEHPMVDIRMVGTIASTATSLATPRIILKEITSLSRNIHAKNLPAGFEIWPSATARENDSSDAELTTIPYTPVSSATKSLKAFIESLSISPDYLWIRPRWTLFTVTSVDAAGESLITTTWDATGDRSLGAFRAKLLTDFGSGQGNWEEFAVWDVEEPLKSYKLVDSKTSPRDWRKDILGWFLSPNIAIRRTKNEYKLSTKDKWGLVEESEVTPLRPPPKSSSHQYTPTSASIMAGIPPPKRFNQERIFKQQVKPRVPPKFEPWIAEQNRLDRLQRESYSRSISVIEPGQQPAAVLYGPARELILAAGNSMPAVYTQRLTPTDIRQLVDENGELRNEVLERKKKCELCTSTFDYYRKEDIRLHYKTHADELEAAGNCPLCGRSWVVMDIAQKRAHLLLHQQSIENSKISDFWKDHTCPVCDVDLHKMTPENILKHVSDHQPDLVRFCSRCSFDLENATDIELKNHTDKCKEVLQHYDREFCTQCSKERSHESDEQWTNHKRDGICNKSRQHFCPKCGVNEDDLPQPVWLTHKNHRCRTPGGLRKTFCGKCAKNLKKMTPLELEFHRQDCFLKEPKAVSEKARYAKLTENIRIESRLVRANKADSNRLRAKEKELKELEDNLVVREDRLQTLESITAQAKVDNAAVVRLIAASKGDHTPCPFTACDVKVGLLTKGDAIAHFANTHATGSVYTEESDGQKYGAKIKVTPDGADLKRHYGTSHTPPSTTGRNTTSSSTAVSKLRYALTNPNGGYVAQAQWLANAAEELKATITTFPTHVSPLEYSASTKDRQSISKPSTSQEPFGTSSSRTPTKSVVNTSPEKQTFSRGIPPPTKHLLVPALTEAESSPRKPNKRPRDETPIPDVTVTSPLREADAVYASSDTATPNKLKRVASAASGLKQGKAKKAKIEKSPDKKVVSKKDANGSAGVSRAASMEIESRRVTRATSGTPAPLSGSVAPKTFNLRRHKQAEIQEEDEEDDESNHSGVEEEVDDSPVIISTKSRRGASGRSPQKK